MWWQHRSWTSWRLKISEEMLLSHIWRKMTKAATNKNISQYTDHNSQKQILQFRVGNTNFFYSNHNLNNKTSAYEHTTIDFVEPLCLFVSYSYREKFYNFKYSFHYLHAVQTKPCVNMESWESCVTRLWCALANIAKVSTNWNMCVC